jgi:hypothetical protein
LPSRAGRHVTCSHSGYLLPQLWHPIVPLGRTPHTQRREDSAHA